MDLVKVLSEQQVKSDLPTLKIGDTVKVHAKISYGVGVEKTFPVHSPNVAKFEVVRSGKVRRAKLYYLRGRVGKAAKIAEKI